MNIRMGRARECHELSAVEVANLKRIVDDALLATGKPAPADDEGEGGLQEIDALRTGIRGAVRELCGGAAVDAQDTTTEHLADLARAVDFAVNGSKEFRAWQERERERLAAGEVEHVKPTGRRDLVDPVVATALVRLLGPAGAVPLLAELGIVPPWVADVQMPVGPVADFDDIPF